VLLQPISRASGARDRVVDFLGFAFEPHACPDSRMSAARDARKEETKRFPAPGLPSVSRAVCPYANRGKRLFLIAPAWSSTHTRLDSYNEPDGREPLSELARLVPLRALHTRIRTAGSDGVRESALRGGPEPPRGLGAPPATDPNSLRYEGGCGLGTQQPTVPASRR
jgi:hypothetical protein